MWEKRVMRTRHWNSLNSYLGMEREREERWVRMWVCVKAGISLMLAQLLKRWLNRAKTWALLQLTVWWAITAWYARAGYRNHLTIRNALWCIWHDTTHHDSSHYQNWIVTGTELNKRDTLPVRETKGTWENLIEAAGIALKTAGSLILNWTVGNDMSQNIHNSKTSTWSINIILFGKRTVILVRFKKNVYNMIFILKILLEIVFHTFICYHHINTD